MDKTFTRYRSPLYSLAAWGLLCLSCSTDTPPSSPYFDAQVHLSIDLSREGYPLRTPLGTVEVHTPRHLGEYTGLGGIVVIRGIEQNSRSRYYAYDMACPYEVPTRSIIRPYEGTLHEGLILYQCPTCHSVYELALGTGHPIAGVSTSPLQQYTTREHEDQIIVLRDK